MDIAILLYPGFTALDAIGPAEVLSRLPDTTVRYVATQPGPVTTDTGVLTVDVATATSDVPHPEVLLVPGGPGQEDHMADEVLLGWIRAAHATSRWTTSVCTGSLLLGAAGVLDGLPATSHWLALHRLADYGATPVAERVVHAGKVVTAAGVSAGIDLGLTLAADLADEATAKMIQLFVEYDPAPPFDAGSPRTAPADLVAAARASSRHTTR